MDLRELQELAGRVAPMSSNTAPILLGRTLYIDGDGLAYNCAGSDDVTPEEARYRTQFKIASLKAAAQAENVVLLLTGSGSHKGHRYALARVKAYQAHRSHSRRPANWGFLRGLLEAGVFGITQVDYDREADDRFGQYGWGDPENTVIATQDKDMRMVPGHHLNWDTHRMFYVAPETYDAQFADKQYGEKWFWLQMLLGDSADNIPGLPKAYGKLCGEITAGRLLRPATTGEEAADIVSTAYASCYGTAWAVQLAEQACLLWMRHTPEASWHDAFKEGGPLKRFNDSRDIMTAYQILRERVQQAEEINELSAQAIRDSRNPD